MSAFGHFAPAMTSLDANPGATYQLNPPLCNRPVTGDGMLSLLEKSNFSKAYGAILRGTQAP
jgi:hypothetical protein